MHRGLPLILWLNEVSMEIGNDLQIFYEVDKSYCEYGYMGMAQILVEMDLKRGLSDSIIIKKGT